MGLFFYYRVCPDELKEAISSLLYASSRCGDFPELQEIRTAFTSRYGKEFVASAIELRNNCRVNPKVCFDSKNLPN
jgi:vacuolar protein sorting-associated protein IST1